MAVGETNGKTRRLDVSGGLSTCECFFFLFCSHAVLLYAKRCVCLNVVSNSRSNDTTLYRCLIIFINY